MSAVLLPHTAVGSIDWPATEAHIARTHAAGLIPAVNMDTGYVQLLDAVDRDRVLDLAASVTGSEFVAGAYVGDQAGDRFDLGAYLGAASAIAAAGHRGCSRRTASTN
jgi:dihydrodipicolinate synthase/N-acetylneuraminate lyase